MPRPSKQPQRETAADASPTAVNGASKHAVATKPTKAKDDSATAAITFAQRLAHPDLSIRTQNLKRLSSFLHRRQPITPLDLAKIYKGLFYLFWLSDKPLPQQAMAERLAAMQSGMREARWLDVVTGFWLMIRREWTGIDRLRLDKYMTWVRCMVTHSLRYLSKRQWTPQLTQQWIDTLVSFPLANDTTQRGLFLHVTDIYVTEWNRVLSESESEAEASEGGSGGVEWSTVEQLLQPFWPVVSTCPDASMVKRVEEEVLEALYRLAAEEGEEGRSALHNVMRANAGRMADKLFALASDKSTLNKYRTRLYKLRDMWQSLQRQQEETANNTTTDTTTSSTATNKKRKNEQTTEQPTSTHKKIKKSQLTNTTLTTTKHTKPAVNDSDDDSVPILVQLDDDSTHVLTAKERSVEREKARRAALVAKVTRADSKAEQVGRLDSAVMNGSVFADAADFEVPEFGYDEAEDETEEEEGEGDEDDMGVILRAEEENEEGEDSFVQDEEGTQEEAQGRMSDEDTEDGHDDSDVAMDDDSLFMDADAFERAVEQEDDFEDEEEEQQVSKRRKSGKAAKQQTTAQPPVKPGKGKQTTAEKLQAADGDKKSGKQSNGNGALNGRAEKVATKGKQQQKQRAVEELKQQDDAHEDEAEREAEAEMENQKPQKKQKKKSGKQTSADADTTAENSPQQNGKKKATKAKATPQQDKVKEEAEPSKPHSTEQPANSSNKKQSKKAKQATQKAAEEEKVPTVPTAQDSVTEEKKQLSAAAAAPAAPSPFLTPRLPNKTRSRTGPSTDIKAAPHTAATVTTTTTTSVAVVPSTPSSVSLLSTVVLPSTPVTSSRTPKRVSISLEHNRVQQFHHWKPLEVKADDTPLNHNRSTPKSVLRVRTSVGAVDGGGGGSGGVGRPSRPSAADFF